MRDREGENTFTTDQRLFLHNVTPGATKEGEKEDFTLSVCVCVGGENSVQCFAVWYRT